MLISFVTQLLLQRLGDDRNWCKNRRQRCWSISEAGKEYFKIVLSTDVTGLA